MNFFDRYLSVRVVEKSRLELVSWLCLHLASSVNDIFCISITFVFIKILAIIE